MNGLDRADSMFDTLFGCYEIPGEMLVDYHSHGTDENHNDCMVAEIIGLHLGGNVVLSRDQLIQIENKSAIERLETIYSEERP